MNYIAERRQEEKDRRRTEILDAAEAVAASEGFDALTMDQVARRARISRALLYVYFQDRDDLHFGLCERALALLQSRFEAAAARRGTGLQKIVAIGRAYVAFAAEFPVHFAALASFQAHEAGTEPGTGNVAACFTAGEKVHQAMFAVIEAGQRDGSIATSAGWLPTCCWPTSRWKHRRASQPSTLPARTTFPSWASTRATHAPTVAGSSLCPPAGC